MVFKRLENLLVSKNYNACYVELSPLCQQSGQLYKEGVSISKITAFVWKRL